MNSLLNLQESPESLSSLGSGQGIRGVIGKSARTSLQRRPKSLGKHVTADSVLNRSLKPRSLSEE